MAISPLAKSYKTFFLTQSHSTAKVKLLAKEVIGIRELKALLELCTPIEPYPIPEASAWTIRHAITNLTELQTTIITLLLKTMNDINRDSYIKNTLGVIKHHSIPSELYGHLADTCLNYLTEPFRSRAVHYYSVEIMTTICKEVPELTREFLMLADELEPLASNAMKRKLVKVRKTLLQKKEGY